MSYTKILFCFFIIVFSGLFSSCQPAHSESEIEAAMQHYDRLIQKIDADSIALLFTEDGDLGTSAHGRDSIRQFLSSFKNVQVLSATSHTNNIHLTGDSATQKGTYKQLDVMNGKDTVRASGSFTAQWLWIQNSWHIKRMDTQSL